jgi:hypothetical protein
MRSLPLTRRRWLTKTCSNTAPTAEFLYKRKEWQSNSCPRCNKAIETNVHVLTCDEPMASAAWDKALADVDNWLNTQRTEPLLHKLIMEGIQSIKSGKIPVTRNPILFLPCFLQNEMGWHNLFTGCAAEGWSTAQQRHYNIIQTYKSGERWLTALLKKLLQISWDFWEIRNGIVHASDTSIIGKRCNAFITACFALPVNTWDKETKALIKHKDQLTKRHVSARYAWCVRIQAGLTYKQIQTPTFKP